MPETQIGVDVSKKAHEQPLPLHSRHEPARAREVSRRPMPHLHGAPSRPWMIGH